MTEADFAALIDRGYETRGVEFKAPGLRSDPFFLAKVARAVLGMANNREGGLVVIGVEAGAAGLEAAGLTPAQLKTWQSYDEVAAAINAYANPSVGFDLEVFRGGEKAFVLLRVSEFDEIPILCRKEYVSAASKGREQVLRPGACYVRSRHKPETSEIPSEEAMRELLELAVDKGMRRFIARAMRAGLFPTGPAPSMSPSDAERFDEQLGGMG